LSAPKVSFVIPCYKLAHLLSECVNSILSQSYGDFEVLIMDDCSPDNTPEVAASFQDPRVKHVRNEPNLGHLRNYNKGISLSRGKYVWLISADDCLRRPYVLERYVRLMESHPRLGYVFCPAMKLRNGSEVGICGYSIHGDHDSIFDGRQFVANLIHANTIVSASGMVRKQCYDEIGVFPLNMPWAGDWYLWCVFALHTDVGYFAEPMVYYREHELSMTTSFMNQDLGACSADDLSIPWIIKAKSEELGYRRVSKSCLYAIAIEYARHIASKRYKTSAGSSMPLSQFEAAVKEKSSNERETAWVRARVFAHMADLYYSQAEFSLAGQFYRTALSQNPWLVKTWVKRFLLSCGDIGKVLRRTLGEAAG
jgi:glycosyltransferase involved in cell wall biosynthesis